MSAVDTKRGATESTAIGVGYGTSHAAADCSGRDVCFTCPRRGTVLSHRDSLSSWPWPGNFHRRPQSSPGRPTGRIFPGRKATL